MPGGSRADPVRQGLPIAPDPAAARLDGIQAARAVAAFCVVVTHGISHPFPAAPGVAHLLGRFGVTLFFVISGLIMIRSTGPGPFRPGRFIGNRLRRIVPSYWLVCLVLLACVLLVPRLMKSTVFVPDHFLKSMLFIPAWHPNIPGVAMPFFKLGWTLNYEMFFYLCFASTFALSAMRRTAVLTAIFVALAAVGTTLSRTDPALWLYTRVDILAFVTGMWVGVLTQRGWALSPLSTRLLWIASLLVLAAIAWRYDAIREAPATQIWLIAASTGLVAVLVRPRFAVPGWLRYAGDASYSLYLWHMFGVAAVTAVVNRLPGAMLVPGMVAAVVAGTAFGLLVYRFVEAPMNRWLRRTTSPRPAASATAVTPLGPADGL